MEKEENFSKTFKNCTSIKTPIQFDTSNCSKLYRFEHLNDTQKKYCFENNLIQEYPLIGISCFINGSIRKYFDNL